MSIIYLHTEEVFAYEIILYGGCAVQVKGQAWQRGSSAIQWCRRLSMPMAPSPPTPPAGKHQLMLPSSCAKWCVHAQACVILSCVCFLLEQVVSAIIAVPAVFSVQLRRCLALPHQIVVIFLPSAYALVCRLLLNRELAARTSIPPALHQPFATFVVSVQAQHACSSVGCVFFRRRRSRA